MQGKQTQMGDGQPSTKEFFFDELEKQEIMRDEHEEKESHFQ